MGRINIRYTGTTEQGVVYENENRTYIVQYPCSSPSDCSHYEINLERGKFNIECWGASGYIQSNGFSIGGFTTGILSLAHSQTFYVYIGSMGIQSTSLSYNGGGGGSAFGFSGGGATDIRLSDGHYSNFTSLLSRIMVAGGGGGHNMWTTDANIKYYGERNNAGGLIGGNGIIKQNLLRTEDITFATGGTQMGGGIGGHCVNPCHYGNKTIQANGIFGIGGNGTHSLYSAGGGGGYFGGGAGHVDDNILGGGGGGSSYISGYNGCLSVSQYSTPANIISSSNSIHFSGLRFVKSLIGIGSNGNGHFIISDITDEIHFDICTQSFHSVSLHYALTLIFLSK